MTDLTEVLARAIFVGADDNHNTWPSPAHPECQKMARNCLAALDAAGYQIVPKEPTDAMGAAGLKAYTDKSDGDHIAGNPSKWMKPTYRAMLAAAPKP